MSPRPRQLKKPKGRGPIELIEESLRHAAGSLPLAEAYLRHYLDPLNSQRTKLTPGQATLRNILRAAVSLLTDSPRQGPPAGHYFFGRIPIRIVIPELVAAAKEKSIKEARALVILRPIHTNPHPVKAGIWDVFQVLRFVSLTNKKRVRQVLRTRFSKEPERLRMALAVFRQWPYGADGKLLVVTDADREYWEKANAAWAKERAKKRKRRREPESEDARLTRELKEQGGYLMWYEPAERPALVAAAVATLRQTYLGRHGIVEISDRTGTDWTRILVTVSDLETLPRAWKAVSPVYEGFGVDVVARGSTPPMLVTGERGPWVRGKNWLEGG